MKLKKSMVSWRPGRVVMIGVALLGLLAGAGVSTAVQAQSKDQADLASGQRVITIFDQGERKVIVTTADTVREALKRADTGLAADDIVEPAAATKLVASEYTVNIYRAKPVMIVDGMRRERVLSPYSSAEDIAHHANITVHDEDTLELERSTDVLYDGFGMRLSITRATPVNLVLYGERTQVRTQASTVDGLLRDKDVTLGPNDTVSVSKNAAIERGMTIEVWRNGVQTITEEQAVPFTVRKIQDADREIGYRDIKTPGKNGKKSITYEVTMRNGKEVARKEIQSIVVEKPSEQVEIVGAKSNYRGGPLTEEQITALGMCETGMNPTTNTGNGFYGAFQFMPSTWRAYNNTHSLPHEAPLDVQKQAVQDLLSNSSIHTQFPGCAQKMSAQGIL